MRYQLMNQIGSGGMGTVYEALDTVTQTRVAVKSLKPDATDAVNIERFKREGELLRQLNHPNIVKMLDAFEHGGQHYLVMEYVTGGSLADFLQKPLPVERVMEIALDLADALTRAHRLNVIHRDLKPANVLIAEDGTPRLTDFGIAAVKGVKMTETGAIMGTLAYLSPEGLTGETVDSRSDIWSFGVMLFEMLAGQHPFYQGQLHALINAIVSQPPPDLESLRPDLPPALIDLVYRMLVKNPSERIPSVRLVGSELEAILQHRTPSEKRFIAPTTEKRIRHNLPAQPTPFVGRESELQEVARLIDTNRLVTILAMGGMGKTRLALEAAARQTGCFEGGIYFVGLAPYTDPALIVQAIAEGLQFYFSGTDDPKTQLLNYLREKQILLVLDNFEHLISGADIVSEILREAPLVKILVTSRERLNLQGETLFNLGGMDFPDWETPQDALEYAAVKLMMQSIRRNRPDFELQAEDLTYVARICRLAYGVPLAIELAAAWIDSLSLEEITDEMQHNLDFLETNLRDVPERQRSLRSVFEYSWRLLSDHEKSLFSRMSVFRGGFTRQAGQTITGASVRDLNTLVNKSLLKRDTVTGRYHIHELLRQYAGEALTDSEAIYSTHCEYYAAAMEKRMADLKGGRQLEALDEIEADFENVRAAWDWAVQNRREIPLNQMVPPVARFLSTCGRFSESVDLFEKALAQWTTEDELRGRLLSGYGIALGNIGEPNRAIEPFEKSLALFRETGKRAEMASALLGMAFVSRSDYQAARPLAEEALALAQEIGDKWLIAVCLNTMGAIEYGHHPEITIILIEQSLQMRREIGDRIGSLGLLNNLSLVRFQMEGRYGEGLALIEESVKLSRELKLPEPLALSLSNLAYDCQVTGNYDKALRAVDESIQIYRELGVRYEIGRNLLVHAELVSQKGEHELARQLFNESSTFFNNPSDPEFLFKGGLIAYNREDYQEALGYGEKAFESVRQSPNPLMLAIVHILTALVQLRINNLDSARQHLLEGMPISFRMDIPQFFRGLYGIAELSYKTGASERTAELAAWLVDDERSPYIVKKEAQTLLDQLERELLSEQFTAAVERGKSLADSDNLLNIVMNYLGE